VPAYLIDNAAELKAEWLQGKKNVGVTAGASAPEVLVENVVTRLREMGVLSVNELQGISENVVFPLPKALTQPL
jgi:4-hydroxy-3-methylbut-2-enyl diphosphate reductase